MTILMCERHGRQAGEKVSKLLAEKLSLGIDVSEQIRDLSFVIDDYECPFYGLEEEIAAIPEPHNAGTFQVESDERLNELLGRITAICLTCLKDAMPGRRLPTR